VRKETLGALEAFIASQTVVIDDKAMTVEELASRTGKSTYTIRRGLRQRVESGEIEKVKKRVGIRLADAYRNTVR
jgi:DeoR/GlpR family transcriptional regulator of sugar metabolism